MTSLIFFLFPAFVRAALIACENFDDFPNSCFNCKSELKGTPSKRSIEMDPDNQKNHFLFVQNDRGRQTFALNEIKEINWNDTFTYLTMSVWFKIVDVESFRQDSAIVSNQIDSTYNLEITIREIDSQTYPYLGYVRARLRLLLDDGKDEFFELRAGNKAVVAPFEWTHAAVTFDGFEFQLYVNTYPVADETISNAVRPKFEPSFGFGLGCSINPGFGEPDNRGMIGNVDEFRLYNVALSRNDLIKVFYGFPVDSSIDFNQLPIPSKPNEIDGGLVDFSNDTNEKWTISFKPTTIHYTFDEMKMKQWVSFDQNINTTSFNATILPFFANWNDTLNQNVYFLFELDQNLLPTINSTISYRNRVFAVAMDLPSLNNVNQTLSFYFNDGYNGFQTNNGLFRYRAFHRFNEITSNSFLRCSIRMKIFQNTDLDMNLFSLKDDPFKIMNSNMNNKLPLMYEEATTTTSVTTVMSSTAVTSPSISSTAIVSSSDSNSMTSDDKTMPSSQSPPSGLSTQTIVIVVSIIAGIICCIAIVTVVIYFKHSSRHKDDSSQLTTVTTSYAVAPNSEYAVVKFVEPTTAECSELGGECVQQASHYEVGLPSYVDDGAHYKGVSDVLAMPSDDVGTEK